MKRTLLVIGLLFALTPRVFAQCPSPHAAALLKQQPIGAYAKEVIKRADAGITRAKQEANQGSIFELAWVDMVGAVTAALLALIDTDVQLVEHSADLERVTSCLHIDIAILEAKIEEVRCELNTALDNKSPAGIYRLKTLLQFLKDRVQQLQRGALDPLYEDEGWQHWYGFDDLFKGWCCEYQTTQTCVEKDMLECTSPTGGIFPGNFHVTKNKCLSDICWQEGDNFLDPNATAEYSKICPFDSDYLAPSTTGYGCHPNKLAAYVNGMGLSPEEDGAVAEEKALKDLNAKRDSFIGNVGHLKDITLELDKFMKRQSDQRLLNTTDPNLPYFGNTKTDSISYKKKSGCDADKADPSTGLKPSQSWAAVSLRNPFTLDKDHLTIWQSFLRLMHRYANDRELPDTYKKPEEFWTEPERSSAKAEDTPILWVVRDNFRDLVLDFTYQQASLDSAIYPKVVDAPQRVTETLQPVRKHMRGAMDLLKKPGETVAGTADPASSSQGKSLRTFVRDYAYFLRRSCIDRPCGKQLDSVLKIIFQDDCFPYANGKYQTPNNNAAEKCKSAIQ